MRRSVIGNFERAGVSQVVAVGSTGYKAASVYRRYRIVDETDLREALAKREAVMKRDQARVVVSMNGKVRNARS